MEDQSSPIQESPLTTPKGTGFYALSEQGRMALILVVVVLGGAYLFWSTSDREVSPQPAARRKDHHVSQTTPPHTVQRFVVGKSEEVQSTLAAVEEAVSNTLPLGPKFEYAHWGQGLAHIHLKEGVSGGDALSFDALLAGKCQSVSVSPAETDEVVPDQAHQYYRVALSFYADYSLDDQETFSTIRHTMDALYRAVLTRPELHISFIEINANLRLEDKYGGIDWRPAYHTSLLSGRYSLNGSRLDGIDLKDYWSVVFKLPIFDMFRDN